MSNLGPGHLAEVDAASIDAAQEITRLYGAMWRRFQPPRQPISGSDITPRMLGILRHLAELGPLTELVDRLQAKGLVERMRDERDQRRVFVWLTEVGRERIRSLAASRLDDPFLAAVAALSPTMRAHIIEGLGELLRAADTSSSTLEEKIS
jgi:DNA-binding MarR family transcriptional regulator